MVDIDSQLHYSKYENSITSPIAASLTRKCARRLCGGHPVQSPSFLTQAGGKRMELQTAVTRVFSIVLLLALRKWR